LVISFQTDFINLDQKTINHHASENAHNNIIHVGISTHHHAMLQFLIVSYIDAIGHIAFATSFDQCANDNRATANIKGTLNSLLTNFLLSLKNEFFCFL
jgi:hypothetical protein